MALVTGSAYGLVTASGTYYGCEDVYLDGAPNIYFQDYDAGPMFNPIDGIYWQLSGTPTYPIYELCCITDVSFADNRVVNDVLCDNKGVVATVQQRQYMEFDFALQSFFPLNVLNKILNGGTFLTGTAPVDAFSFEAIDNTQYWALWCPKVYNSQVGDYVGLQLHKAQFVESPTINMPFGTAWDITGLKVRAFIDTSKTPDQFATIIRSDLSVVAVA